MKAWMTPMIRSKAFHSPFGSHSSQAGIRPMIASMTPPAKMLPKSRRASVNGLTISLDDVERDQRGVGLRVVAQVGPARPSAGSR